MNYDGYFLHALARLRNERRYRVFADLERIAGRYPHAIWHSPAGPFVGYEEPTLKKSFGAEYEAFRINVPRWIPRLTAWRGGR